MERQTLRKMSRPRSADVGLAEKNGPWHYVKAVLAGVALGEIVTIAVLLLFSLLVSRIDLPLAVSDVLAVIAGGIGALGAGLVVGILLKEHGWLWGIACGGVMLLILFCLNAGFHQPSSPVFFLSKLCLILICSAAGGIWGVNRRPRKIRL